MVNESFDELLSIPEVARRLGGLSKQTVYQWCTQGRLQRCKVGSRTMIRASELRKVIRDGAKCAGRGRPKATAA
jgi:excisionase family DNA binding protein